MFKDNMLIEKTHLRTVKSFVIRGRKLAGHKENLVNENWHNYGIDYVNQAIDFTKIFSNHNPTILEVGFGMGDSLVEMAACHPQYNYIGVEVHNPGVAACIEKITQKQLSNIKLIRHDAVDVLMNMIIDGSLYGFQLFFPDPWPKKKHNYPNLSPYE